MFTTGYVVASIGATGDEMSDHFHALRQRAVELSQNGDESLNGFTSDDLLRFLTLLNAALESPEAQDDPAIFAGLLHAGMKVEAILSEREPTLESWTVHPDGSIVVNESAVS